MSHGGRQKAVEQGVMEASCLRLFQQSKLDSSFLCSEKPCFRFPKMETGSFNFDSEAKASIDLLSDMNEASEDKQNK